MAQRRMFSKSITNSSNFLMMSQSTQNLYFHFGMNADDDGFCEHFTIMRMTESKPDDLRVLQARGFIKIFDEQVLVILDWKENNYIQKDRYTPSKYLEIYKKELKLIADGQPMDNQLDTECIQNGDTGKVRLGKDRLYIAANAATEEIKDSFLKEEISKENEVNQDNLEETNKKPRKKSVGKPSEKIPPAAPPPFKPNDYDYFLKSKQRHIQIIGLYLRHKEIPIENIKQREGLLKRNLNPAKDLSGYSDEKILDNFKFMDTQKMKNGNYMSWTLETAFKYCSGEL